MTTPEARSRQEIDRQLEAAGWVLQDRARLNLRAARGVAVREFPLKTGFADYLLFVDRKAIGAVEAKPAGTPLSGVEAQSEKYGSGLPDVPPAWRKPLPFLYETTGVETFFTDGRDPAPRSRRVFTFHQPETLAMWAPEPQSFRARLQTLPALGTDTTTLWPAQQEAIRNLEQSLAADRPRALIQMATGSGKTVTAVSALYRLLAYGGARRVLFLVDRGNLARQTLREFQQYATPDDGRKFGEIYNVQRLQSNVVDPVSRVCITTIQRLYAMLRGDEAFDEGNEETSLFALDGALDTAPRPVGYNPALPIETFDVVVIDECHRSIYNLWRQVVEYFDAHLVGLTATPAAQTYGFFNGNLVMEYSRERAVADGVNVDGEVYRIRTTITDAGSRVEAGYTVGRRDRQTRAVRWEQLDEELRYSAAQLDRDVVAEDQIRTVIRTYRDRLGEIFPGRSELPKTLVFAKDDSHAEEIVRIVREEFGQGNAFCQKITYRVTGKKPEELIASFRNSYLPRIAVTVDMIATGTDIKPLEALLFLRTVKSRVLFDQMLGRGTRVIAATDLQAVTPDAVRKDRFVIIDAVGVVERPKFDAQTLERRRSVSFDKLLEAVALGAADADTLSSLAGRLAKLARTLSSQDDYAIRAASGGASLHDLAAGLLDALDPDVQLDAARAAAAGAVPDDVQLAAAAEQLADRAIAPFASPALRDALNAVQGRNEITLDQVSVDVVREAGFSADATAKARATVATFRQFIEDNKDTIAALQLLYSQPYRARGVTREQIKELAERIERPPLGLTRERLWEAYAKLEAGSVQGAGAQRVLTDLIALVRHAVNPSGALLPYPAQVRARYAQWLAAQEQRGRSFTTAQRWWLDRIAEQVGVDVQVTPDDLGRGIFARRGGQLGARRALGEELPALLEELNEALAA